MSEIKSSESVEQIINMNISENIWNENAELWIELVSKGYDLYRDNVSLPGFLKLLPDVKGLHGFDVGCGEGHNTRILANLGAKMTGIDICSKFVRHAAKIENEKTQGINYHVSCATSLLFGDESFDFVTAFVSLIDIKEVDKAISETFRILKRGGFFQFSITHPCFWSSSLEWILDKKGNKKALACKDYFNPGTDELQEWIFDGVDCEQLKNRPPFKSYSLKRSLSDWVNILTKTGYYIEKFHEPKPTFEAIQKHPAIIGSSIIPFFLIVRCRKN